MAKFQGVLLASGSFSLASVELEFQSSEKAVFTAFLIEGFHNDALLLDMIDEIQQFYFLY